MSHDLTYCDNCGDVLSSEKDTVEYKELPFSVSSVNKGESAILCKECDDKLKEDPCQGDHDPDKYSIRVSDGIDWTVDVWCKKCGRSGSVLIDPKDINW